jgi:hypothetical protein
MPESIAASGKYITARAEKYHIFRYNRSVVVFLFV